MARCDSYIFGECTWGACEKAAWIPEDLGDGGDWALNAPAHGLQVTMVPTVGAVVSYGRSSAYSAWGHCGVVEDVTQDGHFLVREMNYVGFDVYDDRLSDMSDVVGFILPPGVQPGTAPGGGAGPPGTTPGAVVDSWTRLQDELNNQAPARFMQWGDVFNALSALL